MFAQNFAYSGPLPSLPTLLADKAAKGGLYASIRAMLVASTENESGEDDAQMEDESINNHEIETKSSASLIRSIDQALTSSMSCLIAAYK